MRRHINKTFTKQHGQSDCGVACLSSIAKFYGGHYSLEELRKTSGTTKTGTTLLGLKQASEKIGFISEGLRAGGIEDLMKLNEPVILHVTIENRLQHYVVFYGMSGDKFLIGDPGMGIELWDKIFLIERWKSNALLKLTPTDEFKKIADDKLSKYKWLVAWIMEDRNILVSALFLGIIITFLSLATAVFIQKLIDVILPQKEIKKLMIGMILFGIVLLFKSILSFIRGKFILEQSKGFNIRMMLFFFGSLLRLPKSFFDSKKSGEMIARMNDTRRIQATISSLITNLLIDLMMIVIPLLAVFIYSSTIGIILTIAIPFFLVLHMYFHPFIVAAQKKALASHGMNESNYIDIINGIDEVKSYGKQELFTTITDKVYSKFQGSILRLGLIRLRFNMLNDMINVLLTLAVISSASYLYLSSEKLTMGALIAVITLSRSVGPAMTRVAMFNIKIQEARIAFERMNEFTGLKKEITEDKSNFEVDKINKLSIRNLSFSFPGYTNILENVNISVKKNLFQVLTGDSGKGKSTLLHIIMRHYDYESGEIVINEDLNASQVSIKDYRSKISLVSQDTRLFNNYLPFNVTLSEKKEDFERFFQWSISTGFDKYFNLFPQGFMTLLGEEGANISGGQKQLVGLARAIFHNPEILLLDEPTSAMDKELEKFVLDYLYNSKNNFGILMISHRNQPLTYADKTYELKNKTVLEKKTSSPEILDAPI